MTNFRVILCLALALLSATASAVDISKLQGLNQVRLHQVASNVHDDPPYYIYVRLPEEMGEDDQHRFPVVYLLDGGATFAALAGYYRYLRLGQDVPPMIVVGISYGTADWQQGNRRSHDYTLPSSEREHWGGADNFDQWLSSSLIPLIEKTYPADPQRRVIFGQSMGGQFVIHEAMFRPGRFWGHIASNAALHRNLESFLADPEQPRAQLPRLFVSGAAADDPRYAVPRAAWIRHWTEKDQRPFELRVHTLEGDNHFSALTASFRDGLRWLFAGSAP